MVVTSIHRWRMPAKMVQVGPDQPQRDQLEQKPGEPDAALKRMD